MSELRSAVESLEAESLADRPDAVAEEDFVEAFGVAERLQAELLRRLADLERRGIHERDGHVSLASWLVARLRTSWGWARSNVRIARALGEMPATRAALDAGTLPMSAVPVLVDARQVDPEAFARSEGQLVEAATIHHPKDFRRLASFWREHVERERGIDANWDRRRLHTSVTFEGMVRVDGDLDPEGGQVLLSALGAMRSAEVRSTPPDAADDRTPAQRNADHLIEICRQWLDHGERPTVAGERPHLVVTVPVDVLLDGSGQPAEFEQTGPLAYRALRRLGCDASVSRVVLGARSEPLDVGRRTPVVPAAMRRAVVVRDRHCRFPGCDRPQSWCDAHHVVHWADGGTTSVSNLVLLCRRHHRSLHDREGFRLERDGGRTIFRRPDGSVLADDRAPP